MKPCPLWFYRTTSLKCAQHICRNQAKSTFRNYKAWASSKFCPLWFYRTISLKCAQHICRVTKQKERLGLTILLLLFLSQGISPVDWWARLCGAQPTCRQAGRQGGIKPLLLPVWLLTFVIPIISGVIYLVKTQVTLLRSGLNIWNKKNRNTKTSSNTGPLAG